MRQTIAHRVLLASGLDDLAASVKAVGANVVAQMRFARGRFDRQRRVGQKIVRAMHTTLGRGLLVLLDCHFLLLKKSWCQSFGAHKTLPPSNRAFTFSMLGRQRQAQQHFILNKFDKVDGFAHQNRIAVG
jgi:hypothetical protein